MKKWYLMCRCIQCGTKFKIEDNSKHLCAAGFCTQKKHHDFCLGCQQKIAIAYAKQIPKPQQQPPSSGRK